MFRLTLFFSCLFCCGLAACGPTSKPAAPIASEPAAAAPSPPEKTAGDIDVAGLKARLDAGAVALIDVRSAEEFAGGHVQGAKNLPIDQLEGRMSELEALRGEEVYLICERGGRSVTATKALLDAGFTKPVNVKGGTQAWREAGYPVEK